MKKILQTLVFTSCLLAGCTTAQQRFQQGLQQLHGQPVETAMQRLGVPVGEERVAGTRVLVWSTDETRIDYVTQSAGGTLGMFGKATVEDYGARVYLETPVTVHAHCTVRLRVGDDDRILGSDYSGDLRTCRRYIRSLEAKVQ